MNNTKNVIDVLNSLQNAMQDKMKGNVLSLQHMNFIDLVDLMADSDIRFTRKVDRKGQDITNTERNKELNKQIMTDMNTIISNKETQRQLNLFGDIREGRKENDKTAGNK